MEIEKKPGVYAIIVNERGRGETPRQRFYFGISTTNCYARISNHISKLKKGDSNSPMQEPYNDGAKLEFVQICSFNQGEFTRDQLTQIERNLIHGFKSYKTQYGFNKNDAPMAHIAAI